MCGPTCMRYASVAVKHLAEIGLGFNNQLLELGHLANFLESKDLILLVTINS